MRSRFTPLLLALHFIPLASATAQEMRRDTLEVLRVALVFSERAQSDSSALNLEPSFEEATDTLPEPLLHQLAALFEIPTARRSQAYRCNALLRYDRACELRGLRTLISMNLHSLTDQRAEVTVSALEDLGDGRVHIGGCKLALTHSDEEWSVTQVLLRFAS